MEMPQFPSSGGAQGWVVPNRKDTPKADAFCPSQEGIFRRVSHEGLAILWLQ